VARSRATSSVALAEAAASVFQAKGYHNASIDDIAEAAGISRPTVYKYAESKRALLDGMVTTVCDELGGRLRQALTCDATAGERLRRVVIEHVEAATAMNNFYAILFSEQTELSGTARERFHAFSHDTATDFQALLEQCVAEKGDGAHPDMWIAANLVLSMLTSLYRWYDPAGPTNREQLAETVLAVLGALVPDVQPTAT